jgi:zinc finger HIT domain-containing protein 1
MNNFGVIEVASAKTTNAPGWAYVPDTGINPSVAALQPTNRKRAARNQPNLSLSDVSARQEAKIRKELDALDRDGNRDPNIQVPQKSGGARSGAQGGKHTPNVRKILQSQKTFANHLDDFEALKESNPAAAATTVPPAPVAPVASSKRPGGGGNKKMGGAAHKAAANTTGDGEDEDVEMLDEATAESKLAPSYPQTSNILPPYHRPPPAPHPGDTDPLLISHVPPLPSDDELRTLMTAPPLTYLEARAAWAEEDRRYPARVFCEVCGYWGRISCLKCGARICALDCLEVHREDCVTRFGM